MSESEKKAHARKAIEEVFNRFWVTGKARNYNVGVPPSRRLRGSRVAGRLPDATDSIVSLKGANHHEQGWDIELMKNLKLVDVGEDNTCVFEIHIDDKFSNINGRSQFAAVGSAIIFGR